MLQSRINYNHFYKLSFVVVFVLMAMVEYSTFATAHDEIPKTSAEKNVSINKVKTFNRTEKPSYFSRFELNILADENGNCPSGTVPYISTEQAKVVKSRKVIASGYGAPPIRPMSKAQKRLLAMRAAKLDALRSLAEQISGVHIWGGSTVSDLVLISDRIHVQLDAFVQGAKVLSTHHMKDGTYEVVMEVAFNETVFEQLEMNRCLPEN